MMARIFVFILICFASVPAARATDSFPARPLRIVVPFPPGGPNDVLSRILGAKLMVALGKPVIIDNRSGANGIIGSNIVAKSTPDAHTLLVNSGSMTINAHIYRKLPFDVMKDFQPVSQLTVPAGLVVVTTPASGIKSVKDLIALAKQKPGQVSYASSGIGSALHLSGELFNAQAGVQITHVPYKGFAPAVTDLLGGQVQVLYMSSISVMELINSGKLLAIAQTGKVREASLPGVPTLIEEGFPGFDINGWFGVWTVAGSPKALVQRLSDEVGRVLELPDVRERFSALGVIPKASRPEEFAAFVRADYERIGAYVKRTKLYVD